MKNMWAVFAVLSAVFAALTSILAKVGIKDVDSNLATAIRTVVVVAMSWLMVFITNARNQESLISAKKAGYSLFCQALQPVLRGFVTTKQYKSERFQKLCLLIN